jgi:hypothetical protein
MNTALEQQRIRIVSYSRSEVTERFPTHKLYVMHAVVPLAQRAVLSFTSAAVGVPPVPCCTSLPGAADARRGGTPVCLRNAQHSAR